MRIGQRLRVVQMNGCMGTVRHKPREGNVVGFIDRKPYGSINTFRYVQIKMNDGKIEERPVEQRLWSNLHDGILEYQE